MKITALTKQNTNLNGFVAYWRRDIERASIFVWVWKNVKIVLQNCSTFRYCFIYTFYILLYRISSNIIDKKVPIHQKSQIFVSMRKCSLHCCCSCYGRTVFIYLFIRLLSVSLSLSILLSFSFFFDWFSALHAFCVCTFVTIADKGVFQLIFMVSFSFTSISPTISPATFFLILSLPTTTITMPERAIFNVRSEKLVILLFRQWFHCILDKKNFILLA